MTPSAVLPFPKPVRGCCRFDGLPLRHTFIDLGTSPLSNAFLSRAQLGEAERFYPLHAFVCERCLLVQLEQFETPAAIFGDYAYFSSFSETWLRHAQDFAERMTARLGLDARSLVLEVGSNDGYLLQFFQQQGVPTLGVDPAANVAQAARDKGIPTRTAFFSVPAARALAAEGFQADLVVGNNVLAHVPDLNDFVAGLALALKPDGVLCLEFPHLLRLMREGQFDTIYHEHFSYFSLLTAETVLNAHGLTVFDVEELPTHGGSLRLYAAHSGTQRALPGERVRRLREQEQSAGLGQLDSYLHFGTQAAQAKRRLLDFMIGAKDSGKSLAAYGAPAKGNTLLNYCGIRSDFLDYAVDLSPHKQGLFLPGTRLPIFAPEKIWETRPDFLLILPWNLKDEIMQQMAGIRAWGGQFVVPIPTVEVCP